MIAGKGLLKSIMSAFTFWGKSPDLPSLNYKTSFACPCQRHGGLMFRIISVLPKPMFCSREDQSSVKQSFSLPHIMFCLINVSPKHNISESSPYDVSPC